MAPLTTSTRQDKASSCSRLRVPTRSQVLSTSENEDSHRARQMRLPQSWKFHHGFFFPESLMKRQ